MKSEYKSVKDSPKFTIKPKLTPLKEVVKPKRRILKETASDAKPQITEDEILEKLKSDEVKIRLLGLDQTQNLKTIKKKDAFASQLTKAIDSNNAKISEKAAEVLRHKYKPLKSQFRTHIPTILIVLTKMISSEKSDSRKNAAFILSRYDKEFRDSLHISS